MALNCILKNGANGANDRFDVICILATVKNYKYNMIIMITNTRDKY